MKKLDKNDFMLLYGDIHNAEQFIEISLLLDGVIMNKKSAMFFIHNHFREYDSCSYVQMRKCSAHWNNVAYGKLGFYDYKNYARSVKTSIIYRAISKEMERLREINSTKEL